MYMTFAFLSLASVAGFAGGCLCLSITLSGLLGRAALDGAQIMHVLLPRMGAIMAPLLLCALASGAVNTWAGWRGLFAADITQSFALTTLAFVVIALVTGLVHLPLNAQFLGAEPLAPVRAAELLQRWLSWHHVRTALALAAFGALLWPLRHGFGAS